jgi:threonine/homoserine/homoserine lactone efflux protein
MGRAISEVLVPAIGVAISPVPIVAVILVLFSQRARVNGPVFLVGWAVGVAVVSIVAYLLAEAGDVSTDRSASDASYWFKIVAGGLLLLLAIRDVRKQRDPDEQTNPKWMGAIATLTPVKAGGLAVVMSAANPKNLALALAAGVSLSQAGVSTSQATVGLIVFVVLASITIAVPVLVYLFGGERAASVLDSWKAWLSEHNHAVMAVLFVVFGVVLLSQGLRGLT